MTNREQEIVASFKPWLTAYKKHDEATMLEIEKQWCAEDDHRINVQQWAVNMAAARAAKVA